MNSPVKLEPVTLTLDLQCSVEHAFDTYTKHMGDWWPLDSHSVETDKVTTCVLETREGGRIYEVTSEGTEHLWGTVLECRPPDLLVHSWHPGGDPKKTTRVQIRFEPADTGCQLSLVHEGFEILGEQGPSVRDGYGPGWQYVIGECFSRLATPAPTP